MNLEKVLRLSCSDDIEDHELFRKHGSGLQTVADYNEILSRFCCIWRNTRFAVLEVLNRHSSQPHIGALSYAQCAVDAFFRNTVCDLPYMFQTDCKLFGKLYMFFVCRLCWTFDCKTRLEIFWFYILSRASQQIVKNRGLIIGAFEDFSSVVFDRFAVYEFTHVGLIHSGQGRV